ncbi:nose resistant to fluoxetine protein 6-like isoform X2 [Planococcus citri]|uniref:nose resistant to fluoxetine protein 6-like isoform X2 n=1 Tax=Planococcus citri TaxID=170843 RepID=UPI0031F98734
MIRSVIGSYFVAIVLFRVISAKLDDYVRYENETYSDNIDYAESAFLRKRWISELFFEAQPKFKMDSTENTACKQDFDLFKLHLGNHSTWAVKMMESSEWPLAGVFSGTVDYLGNYDQCLAILSYSIQGRYCLAKVAYRYLDTAQSEALEELDQRNSVWNALSVYEKNPGRVNRKRLTFAVCIPSSCTPADLNATLNNLLYPIFENNRLDVTIDVDPIFCKTQDDIVYPSGFYIAKWSFLTFFAFVICTTVYDTETDNDDKQKRRFFKEVSEIFSLSRNFRKLKQYNAKESAGLHFVKVLNILFTIYGHRFFYILSFPTSNAAVKEQFYTGSDLLLTHMNIVVDAFFIISGYLTFHCEFQSVKRDGKFFLVTNILLRWMRIAPVFGVLLLYIIYVFPYTGDGPLWNYEVLSEVNKCKETWWAGLFAINNIVRTDKLCIIPSWYISVDIQLAVIGGILLYIWSTNTKIGIFSVVVTFVASIVVTFMIAYKNQLYGLMRIHLNMMKDDCRTNPEFTNLYIATVTRCGPYLMGFMSAYVIQILNENKIKFTKKQTCVYSLLAILISEACSFYGLVFYAMDRPYDRFENALYAALNHVIIMVIYIVLGGFHLTSGLGVFDNLFGWKIWIPFGRLTYSVYLINTIVQWYHVSSQKQPFTLPDRINLVWWFLGDVVWSYLIGLALYLFVEAPIMNVRILVKKQLSKMFMQSKPDKHIADSDSKTLVKQ